MDEGVRDSLDIKDDGDSSKDPLTWRLLGLQLSVVDEGGSSQLGLVHWALEGVLLVLDVLDLLSDTVDDWDDRELLLWLRVLNAGAARIPTGSLQLHAEGEAASVGGLLGWKFGSLPVHLLQRRGLNVELVELDGSLLGDDLLDGREEGLWVVESVDEGHQWLLGWVVLPGVQLVKSLLDVGQPRGEGSSRLERELSPWGWHLVQVDGVHEVLKLLAHGKLSLVGELYVSKRADDGNDELVDELALLDEHILHWANLGQLAPNVLNVDLVAVKLDLVVNTAHELGDLALNSVTFLATTGGILWLQLDKLAEEFITLLSSEVNLSVRMESEGEWSLRWKFSLNVLHIAIVVGSSWALELDAVREWEHVSLVEELLVHEVVEEVLTKDSITIVSHVTSVHDLSENVLEIIPWHLGGTRGIHLEIVPQHNGRVSKISSIEWILTVETLWSELSPLEHHSMEIAKSEEHSLDSSLKVLEGLLGERGESSQHVCLDSRRRLVGQLD